MKRRPAELGLKAVEEAINQCGRLTDCNNSEISANAIFFSPSSISGSKQSIRPLLMTAHDVHDSLVAPFIFVVSATPGGHAISSS
jgi:hypothetical protein